MRGEYPLISNFSLMGSPLHRVQIDAFLVHVPQRGQFAQLGDLAFEQVNGEIDLFRGVEAADGKANGGMRQFVRAPQRAQHVGRLQAGGGAGRARGYGDFLDAHDQRLAFDEVEADVEIARNAPIQVAVQVHFLDFAQAVPQAVAQAANALVLGGHLQPRDAERLAHAYDLVRGERTRAHAALVPAAVNLRLDAHARLPAHVLRAYAFGPVDLVRGDGHQVDLELLQIDFDLARRLHRVAMENDALGAADFTDRGDVLDHADFVVDHHYRHEDGVGADRRLEFFQIEQAVRLRAEIGRLEALALEVAHRVQHRLVLGLDRDDVLALALIEMRRTLDREVVAFRCPRSPDDFLGVGVEQRRHMRARLLHRCLGFPAIGMRAAGGIAELLGQIGNHLGGDARINRRRRRVVKVNGLFHQNGSLLNRIGLTLGWQGNDFARSRGTPVHQHGLFAVFRQLLAHEILQRHRIQVIVQLYVQRGPQPMRHAALVFLAVFQTAALRRIERLVHGEDNLGHRNLLGRARQAVTTAGTAHAFHQRMSAQLAEQLLQIRQGNALAHAYAGQSHRSLLMSQRQVQHGGDRKSAFGRQSHGPLPLNTR